jgi:general secretion pathway protein A
MTRAPITVITGEVGAGKTTLLQKLLTVFEPDTTVGLISNATGNRGELLQWVLNALDVPCDLDAAYVTKFQTLQNFVIDQYSQNRHVVLIIDEAQNLSVEGLEELRMLTNINSNKDELLQLILMGQPELREMITRYELRQFAQRVTASFHIPDMDLESTRGYIRHRLQHAGGSGDEFTDARSSASTRNRAASRGWSTSCGFRNGLRRHIGQGRRRRRTSSTRSWPTTSFSRWDSEEAAE